MHQTYRKSISKRLQVVDANTDTAGISSSDSFVLHAEGRMIWDALDQHGNFGDLLVVLVKAQSEIGNEHCRDGLRAILDELMNAGLVEFNLSGPLRKSSEVITDHAAGELLVLVRNPPRVHVFNDTSALLWEALDTFTDIESLTGLALEAWEKTDPVETQRLVMVFVATLYDAGIIHQRDYHSEIA